MRQQTIPIAGRLARNFGRVLSAQPDTERAAQRWLARHPLVLSAAVEGAAYPNHVVSSFKFGTDYVADFVAVGMFSGAVCVHLIELEPPGVALFTKKGTPARRLNEAIFQIGEWRQFIAKRRDEVLRELAKVLMTRDLVWGPSTHIPCDTTGMPIYDPAQWIHWHYHVVIGRRSALNRAELGRKSSMRSHADIDVMTYDRLIDHARIFDTAAGQEMPIHARPINFSPVKTFTSLLALRHLVTQPRETR